MPKQTIKILAQEIRRLWPELEVRVERGYCNTDRKLAGTRLRHAGRGRWGSRVIVRDPRQWEENGREHKLLLDHNNAETYRCTSEVAEWILNRRRETGR